MSQKSNTSTVWYVSIHIYIYRTLLNRVHLIFTQCKLNYVFTQYTLMWLRYELYMPSYGTMCKKHDISTIFPGARFRWSTSWRNKTLITCNFLPSQIHLGGQPKEHDNKHHLCHAFANKPLQKKKKKDPRLRLNPKKWTEIHAQTVRKNICFVISCIFQQYVYFRRTFGDTKCFSASFFQTVRWPGWRRCPNFVCKKTSFRNVGDTSWPRHLIWIPPPKKKKTNM